MATYSTSWTLNQVLRSSVAIANGSNLTDTINLATGGYYEVDVQVEFDIASGSPSGDLVVEIFGSVDSGTSVDTVARLTRRLNFTATGNKKLSIRGIGGPHVTLKYTNNTGVSGNVSVRWGGVEQVSA